MATDAPAANASGTIERRPFAPAAAYASVAMPLVAGRRDGVPAPEDAGSSASSAGTTARAMSCGEHVSR